MHKKILPLHLPKTITQLFQNPMPGMHYSVLAKALNFYKQECSKMALRPGNLF